MQAVAETPWEREDRQEFEQLAKEILAVSDSSREKEDVAMSDCRSLMAGLYAASVTVMPDLIG